MFLLITQAYDLVFKLCKRNNIFKSKGFFVDEDPQDFGSFRYGMTLANSRTSFNNNNQEDDDLANAFNENFVIGRPGLANRNRDSRISRESAFSDLESPYLPSMSRQNSRDRPIGVVQPHNAFRVLPTDIAPGQLKPTPLGHKQQQYNQVRLNK